MALVECAGSDRRETATLLLAMAREKGMDTRVVRSVYNGYEVPDELLGIEDRAVLSAPEPEDDEPTENDLIRAWARENGYVVADRGAIKKVVISAYYAAYNETLGTSPIQEG